MIFVTQANLIEKALDDLLDAGFELNVCYSTIVKNLGVPRPTVRRVARDYRIKLQKRCKILSANLCEIEIQ